MLRRKKRGFTIVELLVVIGIILILAAFITPAVQRAQGRARLAQCINNIRQAGMADLMYAQDSNGTTCAAIADLNPYVAGPRPTCSVTGADFNPTAESVDDSNLPKILEDAAANHDHATFVTQVNTQGAATFAAP